MRLVRVFVVLLLLVSLFANVVMYSKWSGKRPVFSVNAEGVTKRDFDSYLNTRFGPQVKAELVQQMVVEQAAKKEGVMPSEKEVQDDFENQRDSSYQIARTVEFRPWQVDEIKKQIRMTIAEKRLLMKEVPVTPDEIKAEYNSRPAAFDAPNKAIIQLAVMLDPSHSNDVKELLQKPVDPSVIQQQLKGTVVFLGYNNKLTTAQAFGTKQDDLIFSMKPGEVKIMPPTQDLARQGAKALVVRMVEMTPGHKADLNDPKTKEQITWAVASRRAKPWQEYLAKVWADTDFKSEDPNDKKSIELLFFPDKAKAMQSAQK